jgi:tetratricopeptide (TPR) repeat protein
VAQLSGDLAAAEREFADAARVYDEIGEYGRRSTLLAQLADVVYDLGRLDEAERIAEEAAALGDAKDVSTQSLSLSVRGRVRARRGRIDDGERLAREAVALMANTDFFDFQAETLCSLGVVLSLAERPQEAEALFDQALELTRRRGNVLLERQVSAHLAGLP